MSLIGQIRSSFTRYEIAAAGVGLSLLFVLVGAAMFLIGASIGSTIVAWALAVVIRLATELLSLCPTCGKSPMLRARGEVSWALYMMANGRLWPERQCSKCGTALDAPSD